MTRRNARVNSENSEYPTETRTKHLFLLNARRGQRLPVMEEEIRGEVIRYLEFSFPSYRPFAPRTLVGTASAILFGGAGIQPGWRLGLKNTYTANAHPIFGYSSLHR